MTKKITIELDAYSSYVSEADLERHFDRIFFDIKWWVEEVCRVNKKVDINWEESEDINLTHSIKKEDT